MLSKSRILRCDVSLQRIFRGAMEGPGRLRMLSKTSWDDFPDPGLYVDGGSRERMETDPVFAEYVKTNLPHIYNPDYVGKALEEWEGLDPRLMKILKDRREEQIQHVMMRREKREIDKSYPLNVRPLHTYMRDPIYERKSFPSLELRRNKLVPGMLLGGDASKGIQSSDPSSRILIKTPENILQRELVRFHHNFEDSRVYNLTVFRDDDDEEGTKHLVVPKNVNWHAFKEFLYCVNFCRYYPGRPLKLPVKYANQELSPGLKSQCFIIPIQRKIEVVVDEGVAIPDFLELDCTGLIAQDIMRRDRLILPEGVHLTKRLLKRPFIDFVIGKVIGSNRDRMANLGIAEEEEKGKAAEAK